MRIRLILATLAAVPILRAQNTTDTRLLTQPAVSHHLTLLRMTGLVGFRRDGKHNYYRIESGLVRDLLEQFFSDAGNGHKAIQFEDFSLAFKRK